MIRLLLAGAAALSLACSTVGFQPSVESVLDRVAAVNQKLALEPTAGEDMMRVRAGDLPNDPLLTNEKGKYARGAWGNGYPNQWYLQEMRVMKAWEIAKGNGVRVGFLGSGVDGTHPDLAPNVEWDERTFQDPLLGLMHDFGQEHDTDTHGYGTFQAGIIGAVQNNGIGISGIAPEVTLVPYRITERDDAEVLENNGFRGLGAAYNIIANRTADVVNLPGGLWNYAGADLFCQIATQAADAGIIVVTTAHNGRNNQLNARHMLGSNKQDPKSGMTPGNCKDVVTVSAYAIGQSRSRVGQGADKRGRRSSHSNFGGMVLKDADNNEYVLGVDIAAPGGDGAIDDPGPKPGETKGKQIPYGNNNILSLLASDPESPSDYLRPIRDGLLGHHWKRWRTVNNREVEQIVGDKVDITDDVLVTGDMIGENDGHYARWRGSMSTAMVTGVIALMLSSNPDLYALEGRARFEAIKALLKDSGKGTGGRYHQDFGYGRLDAYRAVRAAEEF